MKTAIILGATGLTGSILLDTLIENPDFQKIKLFSRHSVEKPSSKIEEHLIDMFALESFSDDFKADVVFCCIGTTKAKTPDKEVYKMIDYGIPVTAAKLAKKNGIKTFMVISALGADVNSSIFYNKTKGEMQRDVAQQGIENTYILQPSLIYGDRKESRLGENVAISLMKIFRFLIPKKYRMISAKTIAQAMVFLSQNNFSGKIIPSEEIKKIAKLSA